MTSGFPEDLFIEDLLTKESTHWDHVPVIPLVLCMTVASCDGQSMASALDCLALNRCLAVH